MNTNVNEFFERGFKGLFNGKNTEITEILY